MLNPVIPVRTMRIPDEPDPHSGGAGSTRRHFLELMTAAAVVALTPLFAAGSQARGLVEVRRRTDHPDPRPGIDASRVLASEQLADAPDLVELFDRIREIPHIVDGIRCYCGCAVIEGYRSLLTCYEAPGMARFCDICEGQGRLAYARWKEGQTLEQIRRATDARYASASSAAHATTSVVHAHHRR
jgi:hypothetical protein